jgi:hypothetical protein
MRILKVFVAVCLSLLILGGCGTKKTLALHVVDNSIGRFSIGVPADWIVNDVSGNTNDVLLSVTRYREPYDDLNPSILVMIKSFVAKQVSGVELMDWHLKALNQVQNRYQNLQVVDSKPWTKIGQFYGSYARTTFTAVFKEAGRSFNCLRRTTLIPRKEDLLIIYMTGAQTGTNVCEEVFAAAQSSLVVRE